jgi:hypothetical protein
MLIAARQRRKSMCGIHSCGSFIGPLERDCRVRQGSFAEISASSSEVRFTFKSGHAQRWHQYPPSPRSYDYTERPLRLAPRAVFNARLIQQVPIGPLH